MNRPLPPGDRGDRSSASRWPRGRSRTVPGAVGLVGGGAEDSAVAQRGPESGTHALPGRHGRNVGYAWRGTGLAFLLLLLARSGGCGLVINPRLVNALSLTAGHDAIHQEVTCPPRQ